MKNGQWTTSINGEIYDGENYDTKEEAIVEYRKEIKKWEKQPSEFYVGQIEMVFTSQFVNVETIIDDIQCQAQDICGEVAEDYLYDIPEKQKEELEKLIVGWFDKNGYAPTFSKIVKTEIVKVEPNQ